MEERKQKRQQRKNMRKQRRQQAKQARQQKRKQKREQNRQQRRGLWKWLKQITAKQRQQMKQCKFASPIFRSICKFFGGHTARQLHSAAAAVQTISLPESFCSRGDQTEFRNLSIFYTPVYVLDRTTELLCTLKGLLWRFSLEEHEAHLIGTHLNGAAEFKSSSADAFIGIRQAVIAFGKIELSSPGTSGVLMRSTDAVASKIEKYKPADMTLKAADLEGSVDIFDCFFLKDLTITGASIVLAKDARQNCMASSESASLGSTAVSSGSSKLGFAANLALEGAVDIFQCVVLVNLFIDTQAVTFETDNSLDAGCVMTMQEATINAVNEGALAKATLRRVKLTGAVDIFGCSFLKSLIVQQGSIAVIKQPMADGSKRSDCLMSLSGTAAIESTAGSSKMTFQSVDLEGSLDIFHCIFLQDVTITGAIIVLHELDCTAIATNGALFGSAAVSSGSSKVRLTNVVLKGEVDILECVVLKDVFVSGGVGVKDADTDCVFHADSASINAVDEYSSPRVLASSSLRLEGPVNIFHCTVLTGDVTITGGSISWKPDDETASGCVITGHEDASIEFILEDSSLQFRNVRLSGSIDFGSCGYFQDVNITGLTLQRTAHATYSCTVSGSKASITATGDKSRLNRCDCRVTSLSKSA